MLPIFVYIGILFFRDAVGKFGALAEETGEIGLEELFDDGLLFEPFVIGLLTELEDELALFGVVGLEGDGGEDAAGVILGAELKDGFAATLPSVGGLLLDVAQTLLTLLGFLGLVFLLAAVEPVAQDGQHVVGGTVAVSLLEKDGQFIITEVAELFEPWHRHLADDGHEVEDGEVTITLAELHHQILLLVVHLHSQVAVESHLSLLDVEQDAVGIALLTVVVVDGFVGEGEVHLPGVAQFVEFLLGGFKHERANLVVFVEGVVGLLDGGFLLGKLCLCNLLVIQLLGESLNAVGHIAIIVDAEEGTELLVVEGLALLVVAVEREEDVNTRCALLLTRAMCMV